MSIKVVKSEKKEETVAQINNLGMTYLLKGMLNEAELEFKRAIEKMPEYSKGHNNLGAVYLQQNRLDEAIKEFKLAIRYDPNNAEAYNNLGVAYCNRQKYTEARDSFRKALAINPNYEKARENLDLLESNLKLSAGKIMEDKRIKDNIKNGNFKKLQSPNRLPTISLCMIVKNEEENLAKALNSVRKAVDEIIIVDTGSTDRTVEVAKSFGAKVYYYEWKDDFASARNEALKHATCDWILSMDADDEMRGEDILRLKEILKSLDDDFLGVALPIRSKSSDNTEIINYLIRLFRNRKDIRFRRRIHEVVDYSIHELNGKVLRLIDIFIEHRGYESQDTLRKKIERNSKILEEEVKANPNDPGILRYMGDIYFLKGEIEKSIEFYNKVLETAKEDIKHKYVKVTSLLNLAKIYILQGDLKVAELYALRAVNEDPNFPDSYFLLGNIYVTLKSYSEAYSALKKVLEVDPMKSYGLVFNSQIRGLPLYIMLTACALELKKYSEAIIYGENALRISQDNPDIFNNLGIAYANLGILSEAKRCFEKALELDPNNTKFRMNMITLLSHSGDMNELLSQMRDTLEVLKVQV